jgi:hypothetical protein
VIHLLFSTGHTAPAGEELMRRDLVERALDVARMLRSLLPDDAEVASLLALILLTDARRTTRVSDDGALQLLAHQDRITALPPPGRVCAGSRAAGTSSRDMRVIDGAMMRPSATASATRSRSSLDICNAKLIRAIPVARRAS